MGLIRYRGIHLELSQYPGYWGPISVNPKPEIPQARSVGRKIIRSQIHVQKKKLLRSYQHAEALDICLKIQTAAKNYLYGIVTV